MREEDDGPGTTAGPAATIKVDPGALRVLAGALSTLAGRVGNAHSARKGLLAPAELAGSAAVAATRAAALAWHGHLGGLASRIAVAGTDLQATANSYTGTDQAAAAHAQRVHRQMDSET